MSKKILIAHRGAPGFFHENTMESFSKAVELGSDMIEFDVRRTIDGVLVAHHDSFIFDSHRKKNLSQLTFSQLQKIATSKGFSVPSVEQILKDLSGKTSFDIELKERDCEQEIIEFVDRYTSRSSCIFTSFNPHIISALKAVSPRLKTGILLSGIKSAYKETPADYLCPRKSVYSSSRTFFQNARKKGKRIAVWTISASRILKDLLNDSEVDAVITNRIDKAVKLQNALL